MPENVLSEDFLSGVKSIDYKSVTTSSLVFNMNIHILSICHILQYELWFEGRVAESLSDQLVAFGCSGNYKNKHCS
jgi:hypothetical protein